MGEPQGPVASCLNNFGLWAMQDGNFYGMGAFSQLVRMQDEFTKRDLAPLARFPHWYSFSDRPPLQ